jgi:hypothetical protein
MVRRLTRLNLTVFHFQTAGAAARDDRADLIVGFLLGCQAVLLFACPPAANNEIACENRSGPQSIDKRQLLLPA